MTRRAPWYQDPARLRAAVAEHGSVKRAAEALGSPPATVQGWARKYDIRSDHPKTPTAYRARAAVDARGSTYLIGAEGSDLVKIGRTAGDPAARMATMQTGSPARLHLITALPSPAWEQLLHQTFADVRRHGEWFALSTDDVQLVTQIAERANTATSASPIPSRETS